MGTYLEVEDKQYKCEDCNNILVFKDNVLYCEKCGLVADDTPIDFGTEHLGKTIGETIEKSRTGAPITWLNPFMLRII